MPSTSNKILVPNSTNVWSAAWNDLKTKRLFWLTVVVVVLLSIYPFTIWPLLVIPFYFVVAVNRAKISFWKQFAEMNGWTYKGIVGSVGEQGVMFKQGNGSFGAFDNLIEGSVDGRSFRVFQYQFSVGEGKNRRVYFYTVFAFKVNGSFPNIYLSNKHNSYQVRAGEEILLPLEFKKQFSLFAPKEYEMEAFEIFTPEVLANLLDSGFSHDIEFINQEVRMLVEGSIDNSDDLRKALDRIMALEGLLENKLDNFKFEQVGTMPTTLA